MATSKKTGRKATRARTTTTRTRRAATSRTEARRPRRAAARGGLAQPVQPDAVLAPIVGAKAQPRSELTKRLWEYIKKNRLQDEQNRRMIRSDEKLRPIFGKKKSVSMFEMTKLVNQHVR